MKRLVFLLVGFLVACSPSPQVVEVTRIVEPTSTRVIPTATAEPTASRASAFSIPYSEAEDYLLDAGLSEYGTTSCLFSTPTWVQCDRFAYWYKGEELSMVVELLHDGQTVSVVVIAFTGLAGKYPSEKTAPTGSLQIATAFGMPFYFFEPGPLRDGDFYFREEKIDDLTMSIWLDYRLAGEVFD